MPKYGIVVKREPDGKWRKPEGEIKDER